MIQIAGNQTNVVTVPNLLWATNGKGRKIFIECFGPEDKAQAQKDAFVLGRIMTERIVTKTGGHSEPSQRIVRPL